MSNFGVGVLGSVVLADTNGEPYKADGQTSNTARNFGAGMLGSIVLIDPSTGEPYKIGE